MRFLLLATVLFLGATSNAEVKRPGTFVPSQCSQNSTSDAMLSIVAVQSVCVGQIAGSGHQAVQLSLNEGSVRTYLIEVNGRLGGMGASKAKFAGQITKSRVHDAISGTLSMTSGITVTYGISLKTSSNLTFSGSLWNVSVTQ